MPNWPSAGNVNQLIIHIYLLLGLQPIGMIDNEMIDLLLAVMQHYFEEIMFEQSFTQLFSICSIAPFSVCSKSVHPLRTVQNFSCP